MVIYKLADSFQGQPKGLVFNSYYTKVYVGYSIYVHCCVLLDINLSMVILN